MVPEQETGEDVNGFVNGLKTDYIVIDEVQEMEACPFCKKEYPADEVKRRSYVVEAGNIGRITSVQPMCEPCFKLVKNNQNLK